VPDTALVPDWRALLAEAKQAELAAVAKESEEERKRPLLLVAALALSILILWRLTRPSRKKVSPT
jgi:hypothetical protein